MRKIIHILLIGLTSISMSSRPVYAEHQECLEAAVCEMNELHHPGSGCEDGIYNAISSSMVGWGVGLFAGIALLTGLLHNAHQDPAKSKSSTNSSN